MEEKIDRYSLLEKALDRLSIIHDTDKAIHCAIEANRDLIKQDNL